MHENQDLNMDFKHLERRQGLPPPPLAISISLIFAFVVNNGDCCFYWEICAMETTRYVCWYLTPSATNLVIFQSIAKSEKKWNLYREHSPHRAWQPWEYEYLKTRHSKHHKADICLSGLSINLRLGALTSSSTPRIPLPDACRPYLEGDNNHKCNVARRIVTGFTTNSVFRDLQ